MWLVFGNNGKKKLSFVDENIFDILTSKIRKMREIMNATARTHFIFSILFRRNCFDLLIAINIARRKKSFP